MRALARVVALVMLPMVGLAACDDRPSDAAPSAAYDTSAASNAKFLADYAARPDAKKTASGLMYRVIKSGNGPAVIRDSDVVTVFYKGMLINGKVFDQTKEEPATFPAGALIPGWVEALKLMKTGDSWEIALPSDLAYGTEGAGDSIPPDQALVFTMTLVKVEYAN